MFARTGPTKSGLTVRSAMRMLFEQAGVVWQINITNPTTSAVAADVGFWVRFYNMVHTLCVYSLKRVECLKSVVTLIESRGAIIAIERDVRVRSELMGKPWFETPPHSRQIIK